MYGWDPDEPPTLPKIISHVHPEDGERVVAAVKPSCVLILSGVLAREGEDIRRALANHTSVRDVQEARDPADEWLAFTVRFG